MMATTNHQRLSRAGNEIDHVSKLVPGAKVMLKGLRSCALTYKDSQWSDQSLLNESIGYILWRENQYWVVELESDKTVRLI